MSTAASALAHIRPVTSEERIEIVDLLRGWALFGILLVNMEFFAWPVNFMFQPQDWAHPWDKLAEDLVKVFAQGKFYTLFSFLFGFGFSIYLAKGVRAGKSPLPVYSRRLLALLAIGAIHAYLIWMGDILLIYALMGFVMLLFRKAKPRALLIWCVALLIVPASMMALGAVASAFSPEAAADIQKQTAESEALFNRIGESALRVYPDGAFAEITRQRAWEYNTLFSFMVFFAPGVLAMFLLGLWAGKVRLFEDVSAKLAFFRRVLWAGVAIGLPGSVFVVWAMSQGNPTAPTPLGAGAAIVGALANPALSACYASALVLLYHNEKWRSRLQPLRSAGRMALTNYLMQSLICTTIFYGYGLGYFGKVGPRWLPLIALAIYALELAWSTRWLRRFHFGPAEWLWRTLTYGRTPPMRAPSRADAVRAG